MPDGEGTGTMAGIENISSDISRRSPPIVDKIRCTLKLVTPGFELRMLRNTSEVRRGEVLLESDDVAEIGVLFMLAIPQPKPSRPFTSKTRLWSGLRAR